MEDVTDVSFRYMCKKFGADIVFTEFVASEALIRDVDKAKKKMLIYDFERPAAIQIYGHIVESMAQAARIVEEAGPDFIDLNFGCPMKKIAARGAGAGLLRDVPKMLKMARAVVDATSLPVTAKTRLGWDSDSIVIEEVAQGLQEAGIVALTIHGRTRAQMYSGKADWEWIGRVKNNPHIKIPIIGNGDITTPQRAKEVFDRYGVDGIMIGRGAIGRPYIFREIKHYLETGALLPEPTAKEKVEIAREHFLKSLEFKGEPRGIFEMRRHFALYFKGLPGFKEYKMRLLQSLDTEEILRTLDEIADRYGDMRVRTVTYYDEKAPRE
jgi:tRNA-dihydrouridine synthase B